MNTFLQLKGVNQQITSPIIDSIKKFYVDDLILILKATTRKAPYGIFLFGMRELILLQLQIDNDTYNELCSKNSVFKSFIRYLFFIKEYTQEQYIEDAVSLNIMVIVFFSINIFILLYFIIYMIVSKYFKGLSITFVSLLLQSYEYIIALPSLYVSLVNYSFSLSLLNILITFILGTIIISIDYGYCFINRDILQKIDSYWNCTQFHLDLILCIGSCFFDIYVMIGLSLTMNCIKLFFFLKNHVFMNLQICKWTIIFIVYRINLILSMLIHAIYSNRYDLVFITCIILFPISYKLADIIFINYYDYICVESITSNSSLQSSSLFSNIIYEEFRKIDIFCRLLVDNISKTVKEVSNIENSNFIFASEMSFSSQNEEIKEKYQLSNTIKESTAKGLLDTQNKTYKSIQDANRSSKIYKSNQPLKNVQQINQQLDEKQQTQDAINQEVVNNIVKIYKDILSKKIYKNQITNLHFSYLSLTTTMSLNSCQSYVEILNIKSNNKLKLGWKDQQKMSSVMTMATNQSTINQRRLKKEDEFDLYLILSFEEEMSQIQQQYYNCLSLYKQAVEKLSMSYIDLNDAYVDLQNYRKQRDLLEDRILKQLKINSQSDTLRSLCINFDFYMLHKSTLFKFYEKQSRLQIQQLQIRDYYSKLSCFLFVSLLEKDFGVIQKINRNLVKAFGFANRQQIVGKSITQILPNNFLRYSNDSVLSAFILDEFLQSYNEIFYFPLFIAKNMMGYAIPLQIKIQSQMVNQNQFGLTIWAKPQRDENLYVLLDYNDPNLIRIASKQFLDEFLYDNFNLQHLKNIKMECLIPIMSQIIKASLQENNKKFETILIKPQDKFEAQTKPNLNDVNFLNYLSHAELFLVSLSVQSYQSKIASFTNVIIDYYEPLFYLKDKIQYIQQLQTQIKELCGISLEFDPNYQQDQLSDIRVKNYQNQDVQKQQKNHVKITQQNNKFLLIDSLYQNSQIYQSNINIQQQLNQDIIKAETVLNADEYHQEKDNQLNQSKLSLLKEKNDLNDHSIINLNTSQQFVNRYDHQNINDNLQGENKVQFDIQIPQTNDEQQVEFYKEILSKDVNSKDIYTKDISKDASFNNLLSTKQGHQFNSFLSKKNTNNINNSTRSQVQPEPNKADTVQESKIPYTQEETKRRNNIEIQSVSSSTGSVQNKQLLIYINLIC